MFFRDDDDDDDDDVDGDRSNLVTETK